MRVPLSLRLGETGSKVLIFLRPRCRKINLVEGAERHNCRHKTLLNRYGWRAQINETSPSLAF
jgi:hypothetical protein